MVGEMESGVIFVYSNVLRMSEKVALYKIKAEGLMAVEGGQVAHVVVKSPAASGETSCP